MRLGLAGRLGIWLAVLGTACAAGHGAKPPRIYPAAFLSPEATFRTWIDAATQGDAVRIRECYFPGLSPEELDAWVDNHLRPEAAALFAGARLLQVVPISPVEASFRFSGSSGAAEYRGVMVRSSTGWKILRW